MVQVQVGLTNKENKIVKIFKGTWDLKSKEVTIKKMIKQFDYVLKKQKNESLTR